MGVLQVAFHIYIIPPDTFYLRKSPADVSYPREIIMFACLIPALFMRLEWAALWFLLDTVFSLRIK